MLFRDIIFVLCMPFVAPELPSVGEEGPPESCNQFPSPDLVGLFFGFFARSEVFFLVGDNGLGDMSSECCLEPLYLSYACLSSHRRCQVSEKKVQRVAISFPAHNWLVSSLGFSRALKYSSWWSIMVWAICPRRKFCQQMASWCCDAQNRGSCCWSRWGIPGWWNH